MPSDIVVRSTFPALNPRSKSEEERIRKFMNWAGDTWIKPDLGAYRDDLFEQGLAPTSVQAHLSTVRGAYKRILKNNNFIMSLYDMVPGDDIVEKKAHADIWTQLLENAIDPVNSPVPVIKKQDEVGFRLSEGQVEYLLRQIDTETMMGLRDSALIRIMLATGVREGEAVDLEVPDLYQEYEGYPALEVREGKGRKQRLVVYGAMENWCLDWVSAWLENAGIEDGPVFRGFWKDARSVRPNAMSTRQVQNVLEKYPIKRSGEDYSINPHDLRRTYARFCYENGMELAAIQQQMGHSSVETTLRYIGDIKADLRFVKRSYA
jgi:site-specific recombinase XerD